MKISKLMSEKTVPVENTIDTPKKSRLIAHDYLFMIFFNALVSILSFGTTWLLLSRLGRAKYAEIVSLTNLSLLVVILVGDWSAQAMVRFGTEEFTATGKINKVFWNRLYLVTSCLLVAICTSPFWSQFLIQSFNFSFSGIIFILFYIPAQLYWNHIQRILPAIQFHRSRYPLLALERLVVLLAINILVLINQLTINSLLPYYIVASLTVSFVSTYLIRNVIIPVKFPDKIILKKIAVFSWPLIPTSLIGVLSTNTVDYLFVRKYSNLVDLGVYALAVQISGLIQQIPLIAGDLTTPRFINWRLGNHNDKISDFINHTFIPLHWLWTGACLAGAILVAQVGPSFIPVNYQLICELVWPLSIVTSIVTIWYVIWNPLLTSHEEVRIVMWSSIATGIVNVSLNFLLIPKFGVVGCAWATACAFLTTCISAEFFCRIFQVKSLPARGLKLYLPSFTMIILIFIINSGLLSGLRLIGL